MARHYGGNANPSTPEEYAEALYNGGSGVTPDTQRRFRDAYTARMVADGSLNAQIREQTQLSIAEHLRGTGRGGSGFGGETRSARNALYQPSAPGAAVDGIFSSVPELFQSVSWRAKHDRGAMQRLAKVADIQNSFGSEVPDQGGFLIPEQMRSEILRIALESAIVRPRATIFPMNTLRVPVPMVDDTSHVSSLFGGVTYSWTEEAAALSESTASFGRIVLDAKKLTGYFKVPNELLQDSPAFAAFFERVIPPGLAWQEDVSFLNGTGTGEPQGLVSCPAAVSVAKETGQASATIVWENIVKMWSRLLPGSDSRAIWIANKDTFPQLATMALSVGTGGGPVWIGANYPGTGGSSGAETPPISILGRPVYFTEKVPTCGTTGDIILADLQYYLIGDRMEMQVSSSEHYLFANDMTAFRILERCDGRPWLQSAVTPHSNSSNTLSAYVQIATR